MHDFIDKKRSVFSPGRLAHLADRPITCMTTCRNYVDVVKTIVFSYGFWLTLVILFITGTQNINFYCLGYVVFCFYFFWHGLDFTSKSKKSVMRWYVVKSAT